MITINTTKQPALLIEFMLAARKKAYAEGRLAGKDWIWAPDFDKLVQDMGYDLVAADGVTKVSVMGLNKNITKAVQAFDINLRAAGLTEDERMQRIPRISKAMLRIKEVPDFKDSDKEIRGKQGLLSWFDNLEGLAPPNN